MTNPPSTTGCRPDACTLPSAELPLRRAEFDHLFRASLRSLEHDNDTHVRMTLSGDDTLLPTVADLTAREAECCSFFRFTITELAGAVLELDIAVPPAHADVLAGLTRRAAAALSA